MIGIIVSGGLSFLFVLISTFLGVKFFKSRNIGQNIQEEVVFHEHKKGTPTMGGIFVILGTIFGFLASHINFWTIGRGFEVVLRNINTDVLGILIISISMGLVGLTNAVNLTDGLDGLVAGSSCISFAGILVISFWIYRHTGYYSEFVNESFLTVDISLLISSISGACLGFLWWNTNPAKIILGDVGSHFIGALFPLILISLGAEGLILFFCFLFLMEEASVVIQVGSFKYRKKRVFKMAPIHHHFEMLNWAETTIIVRFWIINGIFVVLGLGLFYADWVLFGS